MFVKNLDSCTEFTANDGCRLFELLHPDNDPVDLPYSMAVARVEKNEKTYRHCLVQTEVYYILSGEGRMHIDKEVHTVRQGDVILIPSRSVQWLENTGDTEIRFIAIVSPPWTEKGDDRID